LEHPAHRPAAQRSIAIECRGDRASGDGAERQPAAGAGITEIERVFGFGKAADPDAMNPPLPFASLLHTSAKRLHRFGGIERVFTLKQAGDAGLADGKRAQNKRSDRNGFVARHLGAPGQGTAAAGGERNGIGMHYDCLDATTTARLEQRRLSWAAAGAYPGVLAAHRTGVAIVSPLGPGPVEEPDYA